jgi:hypothetical protein
MSAVPAQTTATWPAAGRGWVGQARRAWDRARRPAGRAQGDELRLFDPRDEDATGTLEHGCRYLGDLSGSLAEAEHYSGGLRARRGGDRSARTRGPRRGRLDAAQGVVDAGLARGDGFEQLAEAILIH